MPLFFAGVLALFKFRSTLPGTVMLGLGSLCFLAKPAQTAILAIVFGGILFLIGCFQYRKEIVRLIPRFALAGAIVLGLNLPGTLTTLHGLS